MHMCFSDPMSPQHHCRPRETKLSRPETGGERDICDPCRDSVNVVDGSTGALEQFDSPRVSPSKQSAQLKRYDPGC